jgi:flagellar protein FliS
MTSQGARAYQQTSVTTTDPATLILMLYDGAIRNLFLVREGIRDNDLKKRGEHLSKAIAIITELLSSVEGGDDNEVAAFLRSMYSSMLTELVKVNLDNDPAPLELSIKYLAQMREIWKKEVINGEGINKLNQRKSEPVTDNKGTKQSRSTDKLNMPFNDNSATYRQPGFAATA